MVSGMNDVRFGAYGLTLRNMGDVSEWLVASPADWPVVSVRQIVGSPSSESRFDQDEAVIPLMGGRSVHLRRAGLEIRFVGPDSIPNQALIHPYLAPAASVLANWQGWIAFHAGAFEAEGRAWILTAKRNGGKSTTLAAMSEMGYGVLSDDLVVVRDRVALAGPRSLDLRERGQFRATEDLGVVGERSRWRLRLPSISPELPVAGVIRLSWSNTAQVRVVGAKDRAERLLPALSLPVGPLGVLKVLSLPTCDVRRPRGSIESTIALIERGVAQLS